MKVVGAALTVALATASCAVAAPPASGTVTSSREAAGAGGLYQPLATGDRWTYSCRDVKGGGENGGKPFAIVNRVLAPVTVNRRRLYEFSLQIPQVPSTPLKILTEVMLLRNDSAGNVWIYGYLKGKTIRRVATAKILDGASPPRYTSFDYTGPTGRRVSRFFYGVESSNPTPLGIFTVADYEESGATHDYGYARGKGIVEEDHGPNFEVDCLVESMRGAR